MSRAVSKLLLIFSTGFLLVSCGEGQVSAPQKTDDQLAVDALFSEWDKPGSPGASVAIIRDGKIDYSSAYGEAQVEYSIPIDF
jgi:CubicO group peptidase (beta-lactamase class C family)